MGLTILFSLNSNLGSEHEVSQLKYMIYSYIAMLVTDILWALIEDNLLYLPVFLNAAVNAVTLMAVSSGCYFWFRFIEDRTDFVLMNRPKIDAMVVYPLLFICALDILSIFTGWIFQINSEGHYQETELFWLQGFINYAYLLIPTAVTISRAVHAKTKQDREEFLIYVLYMIAPLIAGIYEDEFVHVPLLALNILMMILILFLRIQNLRISTDALTGLNNRRRLNTFLAEKLVKTTEESSFLIFIIDINNFKAINDQYGHIEGDHALQKFSEVLKVVAAEYFGFAARYGGDEFCLVMNQRGHTCEEIMENIKQTLLEAQQDDKKKYTITVSIGAAMFNDPDETPEAALNQADQMLYEDKKKWHLQK
jgi:diguanylate cyclase (GGDEF)-like protein